MRETCARVLAAALMTAAIATVVAMAAHLGTPMGADRVIAAPPSSLQSTVRLTAQPAPRRRNAARLVTTHTIQASSRPEVITRSLVVVRRHPARRPPPQRELAATAPALTPATPAPAQPADPPQPVPGAQGDGQNHGHGHGHGRGEQDD
jgi:hypothetical protein